MSEAIDEQVAEELAAADAVRPEEFDYAIRIRGLVNQFGDAVIHDGLDLDVRSGEIMGVVGGSGTGKSVLMRSIIGLQAPTGGRDRGVWQDPRHHSRRRGIARPAPPLGRDVPGRRAVFDADRCREYPGAAARILSAHRPETARRDRRLQGRRWSACHPTLAPNIRPNCQAACVKRAGLARSLALDPALLFLDEPTAGLDPIGAAKFDELIRELADTMGLTVFLITHDLDSLYATCDRVAVMYAGRSRVGTIPELLATEHPWIQDYFNGPRGRAAAGGNQTSQVKVLAGDRNS